MIPNLPSSASRNLTPAAVEFLTQAWDKAPATPAIELHTAVRLADSMFTYEARMLHYTLAYNEAIRYQRIMFEEVERVRQDRREWRELIDVLTTIPFVEVVVDDD